MTHRDQIDEIKELREQVKDLSDEDLDRELKILEPEYRWNIFADERNRRNKAKRLAREARRNDQA